MVFALMFFAVIFLLPKANKEYSVGNGGKSNSDNPYKLREFIAFLIVFIIAAIRYGIGTDYFYTYVPGFILLRNGVDYNYYEPAFSALNIFCGWISSNYQILFVVTSLIIYGLLFLVICKASKSPCLSWFVYFCSSLFFNSLSNIRQSIAMVLCLTALLYYLELISKPHRKKKKHNVKKILIFYGILILAFMFHSSAIIFFFVPLIGLVKRVRMKNQLLLAAVIAVFVIIMNFTGITQDILKFSLTFLNRYDRYNATNEMFWSFLLFNMAIYFLMYISSLSFSKTSENNEMVAYFINIQYVAVIILMFSNVIPLADRLAKYYMICQCISVPFFISGITDKKNKRILLWAFILLYVIWILFYIFVYGADGCFPYKCFLFEDYMWQKTYFGF